MPELGLCVTTDVLVSSISSQILHAAGVVLCRFKELLLLGIITLCSQGCKVHALVKMKLRTS